MVIDSLVHSLPKKKPHKQNPTTHKRKNKVGLFIICCLLSLEISFCWLCSSLIFSILNISLYEHKHLLRWILIGCKIDGTKPNFRHTLDGSPKFNIIGTNFDSFEANWILELEHAWNLSLHFGSPNHEFLKPLSSFFGLNQLIFPPKWHHVVLICHFLVFDLHLKTMGPIYGFQSIGLLYFIGPLNLDPHLN